MHTHIIIIINNIIPSWALADTAGGGSNGAGPQDGGDTPENTEAGGASKKRKTGRGSRGVANLTPEQLERKRANDREAQRAIRERQRLRTEQYEREIANLKSTQPYQELQKAVRQKEAVEAELADLKRRMAAIMAMIQPVLNTPDGPTLSDSPPYQPQGGRTHAVTQQSTAPTTTHNAGSTPTSAPSPASVETHGRWQHSLSPVAPTVSIDGQQPQHSPEMGLLDQQRYDLVHGLDLGSDKLGLEFLVEPKLKIAKIKSGIDGAQDSPKYHHVPMKHDWTAPMSMMPGLQGTAHSPTTQIPSPVYSQTAVTAASGLTGAPSIHTATPGPLASCPTPIYALTPRNCSPTCPLDSILLDFLSERRQRAAEGLSQSEILGPRYPSVSSLLNPAVSVYSHPLSKVFTDILARFPDLSALPERVAVLYVMFLFMRWQVSPTQENYLRLPSWFRPVRQQTEKEHPAWFDHIPFPRMRERLVGGYEDGGFPFDNFFIPFTSTLSINWPYEDAYVLLASPTGDELMINPVFEQHLRKLENWTLGDAFERAFPGLTGCYNLKRGS
ncbi:AP-1-like transcription factor [Corynascus novoguineensis]|uniref:AP-1-like transcription factor n=1 Tax=Corynascus novoguineensis TaxID=1126955 RepID=A0AAN7CLF5_9PEZI|nr:AP-1-like transcription factor [Corynascus novoguineensis]